MSRPHLNKFAAIALLLLSSSASAYAAPIEPTDLTLFPQGEDTEIIDAEIARLRIEIEILLTTISALPDSDSLEAALLQSILQDLNNQLAVALIKKEELAQEPEVVPTVTPSDPKQVIPTIDPTIAIDPTGTPFTRGTPNQEYFDKHPELKPFYDKAWEPQSDLYSSPVVHTEVIELGYVGETEGYASIEQQLVFGSTRDGLSRDNPASSFWYANPQVDLPDDGEYGLNVERPHKGKGLIVMNQDDFKTHLSRGIDDLVKAGLTEAEIISNNLEWAHKLNTVIQRGYHQWLRHLDYDPPKLDNSDGIREFEIGIEDLKGNGIGQHRRESKHKIKPLTWFQKHVYNPFLTLFGREPLEPEVETIITLDKIFIDSEWLLEAYHDFSVGNRQEAKAALNRLNHLITHEAAHQFGYLHPNGDTNGCSPGLKCHAPPGSGSVVSYDHHRGLSVNYGVTEEDVKHIPNATYNDEPSSVYEVSRFSPIGKYGVWITHTFHVTGKTKTEAFFDENYSVTDAITAQGFVSSSSWDDQLPSISATYSGTDNFVGADMSAHSLGALLRADANLTYTSNSPISGDMSLTVDNFEVYYNHKWKNLNGSFTYQLGCEANGYCSEDGYTVESWFSSNGRYVGGQVEDIGNEYVGAFLAEKD